MGKQNKSRPRLCTECSKELGTLPRFSGVSLNKVMTHTLGFLSAKGLLDDYYKGLGESIIEFEEIL